MKQILRVGLLSVMTLGLIATGLPANAAPPSGNIPHYGWNSGYRASNDGGYRAGRNYYDRDSYRRGANEGYNGRNDGRYGYGVANDYRGQEYPGSSYYDRGYCDYHVGRSVAIVGGSAAAGAVIGAAAGRGQGAAIGAVIGGIAGVVADQTVRHHDRR